jgi:hypothetical protein
MRNHASYYGLTADVNHVPGGLLEAGLADVMAGLLLHDHAT